MGTHQKNVEKLGNFEEKLTPHALQLSGMKSILKITEGLRISEVFWFLLKILSRLEKEDF